MITNPYQNIYNESVQVKQTMSNEQFKNIAQHLGFLHNTLGKAISDIIKVIGNTMLNGQNQNQQKLKYKYFQKHSKYYKNQLPYENKVANQNRHDNNFESQLQKFQFGNKQIKGQNCSRTISNSQTCSLQRKSINQQSNYLNKEFGKGAPQNQRINSKIQQTKSVQNIFRQNLHQNTITPKKQANKKQKQFDAFKFLYSMNSSIASDIDESPENHRMVPQKYFHQNLQLDESNRALQNQYNFNDKNKNESYSLYHFQKNKISYEPNSSTNKGNLLKGPQQVKSQCLQIKNKNQYDKNQKKVYVKPIQILRSQDSQQMIIRQQKLKKNDPFAVSRQTGRKKADRQGLLGLSCPNCKLFYQTLGVQAPNICQCSSRHRSNTNAVKRNDFPLQFDI